MRYPDRKFFLILSLSALIAGNLASQDGPEATLESASPSTQESSTASTEPTEPVPLVTAAAAEVPAALILEPASLQVVQPLEVGAVPSPPAVIFEEKEGALTTNKTSLSLHVLGPPPGTVMHWHVDEAESGEVFASGDTGNSGTFEFEVPPTDGQYELRAYLIWDGLEGLRGPETRIGVNLTTKPPARPQITGTPDGFASSEDQTLSIKGDEGVSYEYVLTSSKERPDTWPTNPPEHLEPFETEVSSHTESGQDLWYSLGIRAIDKAGNQAWYPGILGFRVDKKAPVAPEAPVVQRVRNSGSIRFQPQNEALYYRLKDSLKQDSAFMRYDHDLAWELQADHGLTLEYKSVDEFGNSSDIRSLEIPWRKQAVLPEIQGIPANGVSNTEVRLRVPSPSDETLVFYKITEGSSEGQVAEMASGGLVLDSPASSDRTFTVTFVARIPGGDDSDPRTCSVRIDKISPPSPKFGGIGETNYLTENGSVSPVAAPEATVMSSVLVSRVAAGENQIPLLADSRSRFENNSFRSTDKEIPLTAVNGDIGHYLIAVYALDEAGNRSDTVFAEYFVDPASVYVSNESARAAGPRDGSRQNPFGGIEEAIAASGRNVIVVASGTYPVDGSLSVSRDIRIFGGFDSKSWSSSADAQTIIYPKNADANLSLFTVHGHSLELKNVFLIDAGKQMKALVDAQDATITMTDVDLAISQTAKGVVGKNSRLVISSSRISMNDPLSGDLVTLDGGAITIESSLLECADLPLVMLKNRAKADYWLLRVYDATAKISGSSLLAGSGLSTKVAYFRNSDLELVDCKLEAGSGSSGSVGLDLKDMRSCKIQDCQFAGSDNAETCVLVRGNGGDASITGSRFAIRAQIGALGIQWSYGVLELHSCSLTGFGTKNFLTILSIDNSFLSIDSSDLKATRVSDVQVATLTQSSSTWIANSVQLVADRYTAHNAIISAWGKGDHNFKNNSFTGDSSATLFLKGDTAITIDAQGNLFSSWQNLLRDSSPKAGRSGQKSTEYSTLEELEGGNIDGGLFQGNRIQRGL